MKNNKSVSKITSKIKKISSQKGFDKRGTPSFIKGNDIGILLIHGLDNTAYIMNEYMDAFKHEGYTIYNTTLPGRGMTLRELGCSSWQSRIVDRVTFMFEGIHIFVHYIGSIIKTMNK